MVAAVSKDCKHVYRKVQKISPARASRITNTRFVQLRSQLQELGTGNIGKIWCETKEEACSIRVDVYKLIKELGWSNASVSMPAQKTAICEEANGWALYVTRFG